MTPSQIFLQQGILGAIAVVLAGVVIFLFWRLSKAQEKYEHLQEKRLEDQRLTAEKYHAVITDSARTLEKLADASDRHAQALEEMKRGRRS